MIPARMGSQRLKKKNLRKLEGVPLITRAIQKCKSADCFDQIWVNSEDETFAAIADQEGVQFHLRPKELGNNQATSEQYISEFLKHHDCELLFQVHSIAPLLQISEIQDFVKYMMDTGVDTLLAVEEIQIECIYKGMPVNFKFSEKTNSQELTPVERVSWAITGWRKKSYLDAIGQGLCATYSGSIKSYKLSHSASHVIKTEADLQFAEAMLNLF